MKPSSIHQTRKTFTREGRGPIHTQLDTSLPPTPDGSRGLGTWGGEELGNLTEEQEKSPPTPTLCWFSRGPEPSP